ncbi:hypothetical protein CDL15_Pgr009773 [Punica granatum]|uniref:Uncharacterized protein n=1 Tax=Punica granatum TaxID=22663 RepID=A0A218WTD5_PUNGR|nr:hypothetical protein CDL15_Pgr009773 [Punica granatum]
MLHRQSCSCILSLSLITGNSLTSDEEEEEEEKHGQITKNRDRLPVIPNQRMSQSGMDVQRQNYYLLSDHKEFRS